MIDEYTKPDIPQAKVLIMKKAPGIIFPSADLRVYLGNAFCASHDHKHQQAVPIGSRLY
jgi:hypothetical protein